MWFTLILVGYKRLGMLRWMRGIPRRWPKQRHVQVVGLYTVGLEKWANNPTRVQLTVICLEYSDGYLIETWIFRWWSSSNVEVSRALKIDRWKWFSVVVRKFYGNLRSLFVLTFVIKMGLIILWTVLSHDMLPSSVKIQNAIALICICISN